VPTRSASKDRMSNVKRPSGSWGPERRLEFVDFRLQWDGRLNRADLIEHFGISVPQASADIAKYTELAPKNLEYDRSERAYVAAASFRPFFASSSTERFLSDLLARESWHPPTNSSYVGWAPPIAIAGTPARAVPPDVLVTFVRAIRSRQTVHALYQSMSRPEPAWREVSPHGIGHDGFRWHARAYCETRRAFRDFVFARVLEVKAGRDSNMDPANDVAWTSTVFLVLVPNPGLSASRRKVVELDYAMVDSRVTLECRQAMLYYSLQRLGLSRDGELKPEAQQIALENAKEVKKVLEGLAKSYD